MEGKTYEGGCKLFWPGQFPPFDIFYDPYLTIQLSNQIFPHFVIQLQRLGISCVLNKIN